MSEPGDRIVAEFVVSAAGVLHRPPYARHGSAVAGTLDDRDGHDPVKHILTWGFG